MATEQLSPRTPDILPHRPMFEGTRSALCFLLEGQYPFTYSVGLYQAPTKGQATGNKSGTLCALLKPRAHQAALSWLGTAFKCTSVSTLKEGLQPTCIVPQDPCLAKICSQF